MNISISVIVPVFNSGKSAIFSIRSILEQKLFCSDVIVVDDGSTDNSFELIKNEFSCVARVRLFKIVNSGAASARNFGIKNSNSTYIAFLDSDDVWHANKIEKQIYEMLRNPDIILIGALTNMPNFSFFKKNNLIPFSFISLHSLLFKNYFQTSTVVILRSSLVELGGFPVGRRYAEEGDLFMRIAASYKCVLINEVMVDYAGGKRGFGAAGLSANLWRMEQGELSNIRGVYTRGECSFLLMTAALAYSLVKFFRRLIIRQTGRLFHGS